MRRPRRKALSAAAVAALAGTLALTAPGATSHPAEDDGDQSVGVAQASGVALLQAEIDAMVAAGVEENEPKLAMLRADLAALQHGLRTEPRPEPGVDLSPGSATRDAEVDRRDASLWDHGEVPCEPIPPDLLTAEEVVGATCRSEPRSDGSSLYVATLPDGTEHAVEFAADGSVTRLR